MQVLCSLFVTYLISPAFKYKNKRYQTFDYCARDMLKLTF